VRVASLGKKGSILARLATLGKMSPTSAKTQGRCQNGGCKTAAWLSPPRPKTSTKSRSFEPKTGRIEPFRRTWEGEFEREVFAMRTNSILTILAIVLSAGVAPVRAEVCPAKSSSMDDIIAAVTAAPGCDRAMKGVRILPVWRQRRVQLATPWRRNARATSWPAQAATKRAPINKEMQVCDNRHRNQAGTMYLSFNAFLPGKGRPALFAAGV